MTTRRDQARPKACSKCGATAAGTARFCAHCGQRLDDTTRDPLSQSNLQLRAAAERRQVTVMFCDMVDSTGLAARIDPEETREIMSVYQQTCAQAIARFGGHIAQTLGDGLLVYFGYPEAHEDDARRAIRAGLAILEAVTDPSGELQRVCKTGAVRIGVHTGVVVAGEVGPWDTRLDMALTGETPNLASRFQQLAGHNQLVIGPATAGLVQGAFELAPLGARSIKGVPEPMELWRVLRQATTRARAVGAFVGRTAELQELRSAWLRAREGEAQWLVLSGVPGIGKSRLVQALQSELRSQAIRSLRFQCSPYFQNTPLHPIVEHIRSAAHIRHEDHASVQRSKLQRLLGLFAAPERDAALISRLLQIPDPADENSARTLERLLDDTVELLIEYTLRLAHDAPTLFVVEDAHWIDRTTTRFLQRLVSKLGSARVLIVVTSRVSLPVFEHAARNLSLSRLGPSEGRQLIHQLASKLPAPVADKILKRADGIPLFIEEITKSVLEAGGSYTSTLVPVSLRDSLTARLDRLGPHKRVLQLAACIGRKFSLQTLRAISEVEDAELDRLLARLEELELLSRRGQPPDVTFNFKHGLIQSAAYESMLLSERKRTHAAIAQALAQTSPKAVEHEPEIMAYHLSAAGEPAAALDHWLRASELAQARSAHFEALAHLGEGERCLERIPASQRREAQELELQMGLARSRMAFEGWTSHGVYAASTRAQTLARAVGDTRKQAEALWSQFTYHCVRGALDECRGLVEEFVPRAERDRDRTLLLVADAVALATRFCLGDFAEAQRHADRVHAAYRPDEDRTLVQLLNHDPDVFASTYEGYWAWVLGFPDVAASASRRAVERARVLAHPFSLCFALCNGSAAFVLRREYAVVRVQLEECLRLAKEARIPTYRVYAPLLAAPALLADAPDLKLLARLRRCCDVAQAAEAGMHMPLYLMHVAEAHEHFGQLEEAERLVTQASELVARSGERWIEPELLRTRARLCLAANGGEDRAEALLRQGLESARSMQARGFELRLTTDLAALRAR